MGILAVVGLAGALVVSSAAAAGAPRLRDPEAIAVVGSTIVVTDRAANAILRSTGPPIAESPSGTPADNLTV